MTTCILLLNDYHYDGIIDVGTLSSKSYRVTFDIFSEKIKSLRFVLGDKTIMEPRWNITEVKNLKELLLHFLKPP